MSFGNTSSSTTLVSGDSQHKILQEQKDALLAEIQEIGKQVDAGELQLQTYIGLQGKIDQLKEQLEGYAAEESKLLASITALKGEADSVRSLSVEKDELVHSLANIKEAIASAQIDLESVVEQIRVKTAEYNTRSASIATSLGEFETKRQEYEMLVVSLSSKAESLRTEIGSLAAILDRKTKESVAVDDRLAALFASEGSKRDSIAVLDNEIVTRRNALQSIDDVFSAREADFAAMMEEREENLKIKETALEAREGEVSRRQSMLDGRVSALRAIKTRLENYYNKPVDLIIE